MSIEYKIRLVAELITKSRHAIAFTGAGISAESGVPTFRGKNGLWTRIDPMKYASIDGFIANLREAWEWYKWRMELVEKAEPNPGHRALAELERLGFLKAVITQNVDRLHQRAGSRNVIELHGTLWVLRCINPSCRYSIGISEPPREVPPICPECSSPLRPSVVFFGEELPREAWRRAIELASRSDLVLVIGTSGAVYPAAYIPFIVRDNGGSIVDINPDRDAYSEIADVYIQGRAGEILPRIVEEVSRSDSQQSSI